MPTCAIIVGVGDGLSASLARLFSAQGMSVVLAARNADKLNALCDETGAMAVACDATVPADVARLFDQAGRVQATTDVVVYNPSLRIGGALVELDAEAVDESLRITAYGAFLIAQQAARRMLTQGSGAILFTGASASIKGYPRSAPFAMGKFALRGLAQSMARELAPQNIHVAHFVIDGGIRSDRRKPLVDEPDALLDPDAIAQSYLNVINQHRSAWSWEVELRPWTERF